MIVEKRVYSPEGKAPTVSTMQRGGDEPKVAVNAAAIRGRYVNGTTETKQVLEVKDEPKSNALTSVQKDTVVSQLPPGRYAETNMHRKLSPLECERLQTLPDEYTKEPKISNSQRYKAIGNGWTVDVIAHILKQKDEVTE